MKKSKANAPGDLISTLIASILALFILSFPFFFRSLSCACVKVSDSFLFHLFNSLFTNCSKGTLYLKKIQIVFSLRNPLFKGKNEN